MKTVKLERKELVLRGRTFNLDVLRIGENVYEVSDLNIDKLKADFVIQVYNEDGEDDTEFHEIRVCLNTVDALVGGMCNYDGKGDRGEIFEEMTWRERLELVEEVLPKLVQDL